MDGLTDILSGCTRKRAYVLHDVGFLRDLARLLPCLNHACNWRLKATL